MKELHEFVVSNVEVDGCLMTASTAKTALST